MKGRITLILMLILLIYLDQTKATLRIIFDRVESMDVPKESKIINSDFHILPGNNSFFQGEFQIVEDLYSSKLKIFIKVFKCLVREAPDTCEYLITLKPPSACKLINAENTAWNAISDAYTPKLRCPLKKGKYVANKVSFDASKWTMFPLEYSYYKLTYKIYEEDILVQGMIVEAHFIRVH